MLRATVVGGRSRWQGSKEPFRRRWTEVRSYGAFSPNTGGFNEKKTGSRGRDRRHWGSRPTRGLQAQQDDLLTIVGPFGAGGLNDVVARMYAQKVAPLLKRTVIVGNKPGAGGLIAAQTVLRGNPQASLLVASNTFLIAAHAYRNAGYDPIQDFTPITPLFTTSATWVVRKDHPLKNLQELVGYAKKDPGKLSYATNGVGTYSHLQMETFKKRYGIDLLHVPFRSLPEGSMAVMSGDVDIAVDTPFAGRRAREVREPARARRLRAAPRGSVARGADRGRGRLRRAQSADDLLRPPCVVARSGSVRRRPPASERTGDPGSGVRRTAARGRRLAPGRAADGAVRDDEAQNARYAELIAALGISLT